MNNHGFEKDQELIRRLNQLIEDGARAPDTIRTGRVHALAEARRLLSSPDVHNPTPRVGLRWAAVKFALILFTIFSLGSAGVGYASQSALPGENLYPLKIALETGRLSFASNPIDEINLRLAFAEKRIIEIQALTSTGNLEDPHIERPSLNFASHLQAVRILLNDIGINESLQAARHADELEEILRNVLFPIPGIIEESSPEDNDTDSSEQNQSEDEEDQDTPEDVDGLEETDTCIGDKEASDTEDGLEETNEANNSANNEDSGESSELDTEDLDTSNCAEDEFQEIPEEPEGIESDEGSEGEEDEGSEEEEGEGNERGN